MKFIPVFFTMFLPTIVWADDLYTNDIINGCGDAYYYKAVLEPITYNCPPGEFLPAGAISCQTCPQTHTCNGGTFTFDANQTQGLNDGDILVQNAIGSCSTQFNQSFSAVFEPITYNCAAGYYLPAGEDWLTDTQGCTKCPTNHYCSGGTYTFNETTTQGITQCPSEHPYAPMGMWASTQCGRKLHIGDDIIYLHQSPAYPTEHKLCVRMNNTIYSANMTLADKNMNNQTQHKLKVNYENNIYSVYDDSMENNQ